MNWSQALKKYPEANFLQSPKYGKMNELIGSKVIVEDFGGRGYAQLIVRRARRGKYIEIPCGPLLDWDDQDLCKTAMAKIAAIGRKEHCAFVRIRPQITATKDTVAMLEGLGLKKSPMHLAAEHTVMIDLTRSEDAMLAAMRRQTRYEVKKAARLGITVGWSRSEEIFRDFHKVQLGTARRQGFVPPNLKTLLAEREAFGEDIRLYVAKTGDEPIAYGMVIGGGKEADYYEAASTDLNRKLPGAYALLWQAILDAKSSGYQRFNLWGIAPPNQPKHRYAGVTVFKTGFGGEIIEYVPAHDLVLSKIGYYKSYIVETARRKKRHL